VTSCSSYGCIYIKDNDGTNRAIFHGAGYLNLKGTLTQSSAAGSGTNDFMVKNSGGTVEAWIDDATGNMKIAGTLSEWNNSSCAPPANSFVIKMSNGSCAAYISNTGNLWLRYGLIESASI
jgi:hypothetical protein